MKSPQVTGRAKRTGEQYWVDVENAQKARDQAAADVNQLEALFKLAESGAENPGDKSIDELSEAFAAVQVATVKLGPAKDALEHAVSVFNFARARYNRWSKSMSQHQRTVELLGSEIEVLREHIKFHKAALDGSSKDKVKPKLGVLLEALQIARTGGYSQ